MLHGGPLCLSRSLLMLPGLVDIWYIVTNELMRDCVLPPTEMEFSVMQKRPEEVRALLNIW